MNGSFSEEYLEKHYYHRLFDLDEKVILELNEMIPDGGINNVVTGLRSHCFGFMLVDEHGEIEYDLFYINGKKSRLTGDLLRLSLHHSERNNLLIIFSKYLAHNYGLDPLDTFNIFQDKTRTVAEKLGYMTITTNELQPYKNQHLEFFLPHHKGMIALPFFYHEDIYRFMFGELQSIDEGSGENYVYLMFNKRNKFIKIGKSKRPGHRERTLQGEEPEVVMIAAWKAPAQNEKILHQRFCEKRERGEWFKLSFKDVENIKKYMDELAVIN